LSVYGIDDMTMQDMDQESLYTIASSSLNMGEDSLENGPVSVPFDFFDLQNGNSVLDDRLLTEEDIVDRLGVSGGRRELYNILMEGAVARDTMIRSNVRLVASIAKTWARQSTKMPGNSDDHRLASMYSGSWDRPSLDEVIQEGIIGLATATDRFEPERGLKFGTYATYWITSFVRRSFQTAATGCLRIPTNYHVVKQHYQKIVTKYYRSEGVAPPMDVVALEMGVTVPRLQFILKSCMPLVSIDAPTQNSKGVVQAGKAGSTESNENLYVLANSLAW
jgi:RNA polymerase sigma factor (sigma-70 family)